MANNPNPQEFNRTVDVNKPEDFRDALSKPGIKKTAHQEFAMLIPERDVDNAEGYAKSARPAKRVNYTSPEIVDRSEALKVQKWGQAAVQGATIADASYKEHVTNEIKKVKDQANNFWSFGAEEVLLPTGNAEPPGLKSDAATMYTATNAYKAGKMSETQYLAYMEKEARRLRSKYGRLGYDNFVDDTIKKVMGFDPANRLREHLLRQAEAAAATKSLDLQMAERAVMYGDAPVDVIANPSLLSDPANVARTNAYRSEKYRLEQEKERLTNMNDVTAESSRAAFNLTIDQLNFDTKELEEYMPSAYRLQEFTEDLSPAEMSGEEAKQLEDLRQKATVELRDMFRKKFREYGQHLTVAQHEQLDKFIGYKVDAFANNLTSKRGYEAQDSVVKTAINNAASNAVQAVPELATLEGLSKFPNAGTLITETLTSMTGLDDSETVTKLAHRVMVGVASNTPASVLREGLSPNEKGTFDTQNAAQLANPNMPDENKKVFINNLFKSDWMNDYSSKPSPEEKAKGWKAPRREMWDLYTNIDVVNSVAELKDAASTQTYINWVADNFAVMNTKKALELQNHVVNRPNLEFSFNEDTLQFEARDIERSGKLIDWLEHAIMEDPTDSPFGREEDANEALMDMNEELMRLKAVGDRLGVNPKVLLPLVAARMGLDPNAPKRGSMGLNLYNAIEQGFATWLSSSSAGPEDQKENRPWLTNR